MNAPRVGREKGRNVEQIRKEKVINIPNALTILRICLLPVVVVYYRKGDTLGALVSYLIAMMTDAVDGFIARRCNQITSLGKLLDPIADKLSLLTLLGLFVADGEIPVWVLVIVLLKELALVAGGVFALRRGIVSYALPIGKVTTVAFILSMVARFLSLRRAADCLLGASLVLSIISLCWYTVVTLGRIKTNNTLSTK